MKKTQKTDQKTKQENDRMIVAWNSDGTFYKLYDDFAQCRAEFPKLVTLKFFPCFYMGFKFQLFDTLSPIEKLKVVAADDIKNKA